MINLPVEYKERMKHLLGNDYPLYEKALRETPVRAFRVNTDKISVEDFLRINPFEVEKIPYIENGFYTNADKIGNHPYHHAGLIYVQEPGAMAPAECLDFDFDKDLKVLDMCAAPGGKSSQLKNKLSEKGVLVSNEIVSSRCKILTGNIERLGLKNTVVTCLDTKKLAQLFPHTFDVIMVDAPCSGEGMFRKEAVAVSEWSEENVKMCAERQMEILENAVECLAENGHIIYATCTFSLEENEMVVDAFLKKHSDFELVEASERVKAHTQDAVRFEGCECENITAARRFYPHKARGEGQFMALLHRKLGGYSESRKTKFAPQKIDKIVFDFLDDTLVSYDKQRVKIAGDKVYYFASDIEIPDKTAFCVGVTIGEIRKNYIQPHHQFFSAFGGEFKRKVSFSANDDVLLRYLHGEEIEVNLPDGYAAVLVDGCALGGIKVSGGRAKNHYPKGLRTL